MRNNLFLLGNVIAFLILSISLQAQQEFGTYFFKGLHQSSELNPSFDADQKIVIGLPSFYGMVHQRGISVNSAIKGQLLDFVGNRRNQIMFATNLSLLKVSYKHKNIRYNLAHNYRQFSDFQFGNPLISLIANGNSSLIGGSVEFNPNIELTSYSETVLGVSYIGAFSVGANVKFLNGIQNFYSERSDFKLSVNDDIYQLNLESDFLLNSSFPVNLQSLESFSLFNFDFVPRNFGLAFDLGMNYQSGPLNFSASVLDIGYLSWNDKVHNYEAKGSFVYDGASFNEVIGGDFNFLDTIGGSVDFTDREEAYRHFVPAKFYTSLSYEYSPKITLAALVYGQRNFGRSNAAVAFNVQRNWDRKHALGVQYGVVGSNFLNFGLSGYTTIGPIQVYGVLDNILGAVNTFGAENYNFRLGMNLVFNREPRQVKVDFASI